MTQALFWGLTVLGVLLLLVGCVGCVVPVIPGPILAFAALWVFVPVGGGPSIRALVAGGALVLVVTVIDYVLPSFCARKFKCSRWGVFGCFAGSIVGLFFMPLGIFLGPFLGTMAGELIAGKNVGSSLRGGFGALLGFCLCLGLKLFSVGVFACWFFYTLPPLVPFSK